MQANGGPSESKTRIVIIGGGMAGLSAAYHLSKNGVTDFKVLEARNSVGGRIAQVNLGGQPVELGANWIHGVLGNPVFELAMQHGLIDIMNVPRPHRVVAATEQGKQVPFKTLYEIYEAYLCFLKRCEEYFISQYSPPEGVCSVGEHILLEIGLYLDQIKDKQERHLRQLLFDCLLKRETCITGCHDMSEIDLLEVGSYTELQGGNVTLPNGYGSILEPLLEEIPPELIVKPCCVNKIYWNKNGSENDTSSDSDNTVVEEPTQKVTASRQSSVEKDLPPHEVEVVCEDGTRLYADHVICTIPLGMLKSTARTLFEPKLPKYKLEAIDNLLFGTVDKIWLEYDRPFLNPSVTEIMLLWEPSKDEEEEIAKNNLTETWFKKIYSFTKVSDTLLLGWISGKEAEYMEGLSSQVIMDVCTKILRKFLNDPYIPQPKSCVCSTWSNQPYTKGSYTAIAVGASQIDIECLAQPMYNKENQSKPVILFAGEHTHSNFYSTVHGAYLTGRTVAQVLVSNDTPEETVLNCEDTSDLSTWIQGISLQ